MHKGSLGIICFVVCLVLFSFFIWSGIDCLLLWFCLWHDEFILLGQECICSGLLFFLLSYVAFFSLTADGSFDSINSSRVSIFEAVIDNQVAS